MNLLTEKITKKIDTSILKNLSAGKTDAAVKNISDILDVLYEKIPDGKRISYGIVYTIKTLGSYIHERISSSENGGFEKASEIFRAGSDFKSRMCALTALSIFGLDDFRKVSAFFMEAAASEDWNEREICQMLFRKLIKKHPAKSKSFLLRLVASKDPNVRRFVAETLRPVCENRWFHKDPDYAMQITRKLFCETDPYPRTSVGNGLSDFSKKNPELIFSTVKELVKKKDKNSYWIAYRACRNLVKLYPNRVMDLLGTDEYTYKKNTYRRQINGNLH